VCFTPAAIWAARPSVKVFYLTEGLIQRKTLRKETMSELKQKLQQKIDDRLAEQHEIETFDEG